MKVSGEVALQSTPEQLWAAFNDPAVLVRTIPGCQRLEAEGPDQYKMTLSAGVAAIKGTYDGRVRLQDKVEPSSLRMVASGSGGPGTIEVTVDVRVEPDGEGARVAYEADAVVGGMIGGVSQRMLGTVGKRLAAEFFTNLDADIGRPAGHEDGAPGGGAGGGPAGVAAGGGAGSAAPGTAGVGAAGGTPAVFERPGVPASAVSPDLLKGALGGAALVLAGVLVGGLLGRRRGPSA